MVLIYLTKLGIAIYFELVYMSFPNDAIQQIASMNKLTRPIFEVCALTAAKGVCSGSIESILNCVSLCRKRIEFVQV